MQLIIFKQNVILYLSFFCPVNKKCYTLKQIVLYITECTFYNDVQNSLGLTSEKQHQF